VISEKNRSKTVDRKLFDEKKFQKWEKMDLRTSAKVLGGGLGSETFRRALLLRLRFCIGWKAVAPAVLHIAVIGQERKVTPRDETTQIT
jgi:hypothetical protein